jgi:hypothetical protein
MKRNKLRSRKAGREGMNLEARKPGKKQMKLGKQENRNRKGLVMKPGIQEKRRIRKAGKREEKKGWNLESRKVGKQSVTRPAYCFPYFRISFLDSWLPN